MKKMYISPDAELLLFAPAESLAASLTSWEHWRNDALYGADPGDTPSVLDVTIPGDNPEGDPD